MPDTNTPQLQEQSFLGAGAEGFSSPQQTGALVTEKVSNAQQIEHTAHRLRMIVAALTFQRFTSVIDTRFSAGVQPELNPGASPQYSYSYSCSSGLDEYEYEYERVRALGYASNPLTTSPCTSVRRNSRP